MVALKLRPFCLQWCLFYLTKEGGGLLVLGTRDSRITEIWTYLMSRLRVISINCSAINWKRTKQATTINVFRSVVGRAADFCQENACSSLNDGEFLFRLEEKSHCIRWTVNTEQHSWELCTDQPIRHSQKLCTVKSWDVFAEEFIQILLSVY